MITTGAPDTMDTAGTCTGIYWRNSATVSMAKDDLATLLGKTLRPCQHSRLQDTSDENKVCTDGEYSGCEIEITPSPSSATPMSTKPPRTQPRKRVIISPSSTQPTRPSSGMSTTPLASAPRPRISRKHCSTQPSYLLHQLHLSPSILHCTLRA